MRAHEWGIAALRQMFWGIRVMNHLKHGEYESIDRIADKLDYWRPKDNFSSIVGPMLYNNEEYERCIRYLRTAIVQGDKGLASRWMYLSALIQHYKIQEAWRFVQDFVPTRYAKHYLQKDNNRTYDQLFARAFWIVNRRLEEVDYACGELKGICAWIAKEAGDPDYAIWCCTVIEGHRNMLYCQTLAEAYIDKGMWEVASRALDDAEDFQGEYSALLMARARICFGTNELDEASRILERHNELWRESIYGRYLLALCRRRMGDDGSMRAEYKELKSRSGVLAKALRKDMLVW